MSRSDTAVLHTSAVIGIYSPRAGSSFMRSMDALNARRSLAAEERGSVSVEQLLWIGIGITAAVVVGAILVTKLTNKSNAVNLDQGPTAGVAP